MNYYRQYPPSARLSDFIECYWVYRSTTFDGARRKDGESRKDGGSREKDTCRDEKLIPGGRVEMVFNFGDPFYWLIHQEAPLGDLISRVHFMGQRDRIYFGRPTGRIDMLGVRFKAGGLAAFTPITLSGLLNKMTPAEYILGSVVKEWEERLYESREEPGRIALLDRLLLQTIAVTDSQFEQELFGIEQNILQATLAIFRNNPEEAAIHTISGQTGWSYKKLERVFLKKVGYPPRHYYRILRFNKAIRRMDLRKDVSLTEIGYDCGYYDQSHFIKDFYRFAGTSPGRFRSEKHPLADLLIRHQPV